MHKVTHNLLEEGGDYIHITVTEQVPSFKRPPLCLQAANEPKNYLKVSLLWTEWES